MDKERLKKYKIYDLLFLTIIGVIAELISYFALRRFVAASFYLSLSLLVTIIAIMRWGPIGAIVYIFSGLSIVIADFANTETQGILFTIFYYVIGNASIALSCLLFIREKRTNIINNTVWFIVYQVIAAIIVALSKGLISLIFKQDFVAGISSYAFMNIISVIVAIVVSCLLRKREGLIVDVIDYYSEDRVEERKNNHEENRNL